MSTQGRDIVVIGTSAGGMETLDRLIGGLPDGLPAAIFIVQHLHPELTPLGLLQKLGQYQAFECKLAKDGEVFEQRKIYLAPPDTHLLVKENSLLLRRGAPENRYRPAVDPLFRSAAVAHGPRVIGVILTGMLDDGTSGLIAVHRCGGVTVVQDPDDAPYPDMPQSALNTGHVDYCVPVADMGPLLEKLVREIPRTSAVIPEDIRIEAEISERVVAGIEEMGSLGNQTPYTCPSCGGMLWEMENPDEQRRYRCYTGHTFTSATLLDDQREKIEETLWIALRMFEERQNLQKNLAHKENNPHMKQIYEKNAEENEAHLMRLRSMLLEQKMGPGDRSPDLARRAS
ncbi:chemotaxis protein CheB [Candidatus Methylomicrobium oryzae]|uniref:chemotaxis protein CheB n=1 Tax=Candidatus Methylomicrobium oryzae TaxID=2802053 RepID=UPI0019211055|nr:chemotaxis protein CheB [Methylomicrobium sp. RS1]MBL1263418.1 chemotaxis protein CheB [Methylomicrobium sp. RS1]